MSGVKALFFDLDGTLLDGSVQREAIAAACRELAARYPGLDAGALLQANDGVWTRYWPTIADQWTLGSLDGETVSREAWRQTLAACGCDDPGVSRAANETHSRYYRSSLRLHPDALELLPIVRRRYSLALITNGASDTQRTALRIVGLEEDWNALVISGETGVAKPRPRDLRRGAS